MHLTASKTPCRQSLATRRSRWATCRSRFLEHRHHNETALCKRMTAQCGDKAVLPASLRDVVPSLIRVTGLAEQAEHVLFVGFYARLVERIHAKGVSTDTTGELEEVYQLTQDVFVNSRQRDS